MRRSSYATDLHLLKPKRHIINQCLRHLAEIVRGPSQRFVAIVHGPHKRKRIHAVQDQRRVLQRFFARNTGVNAEQALILNIALAERGSTNRMDKR